MDEVKKYIIGEKPFIQKKVVWGQAKQIIKEIESVELPSSYTPKDVLRVLESRIPKLIAIVLIPEGQTAKTKNNDEMLEFFEWEMSIEQTVRIIEDFFVCNPIPSWLDKVGAGMEAMTGGFEKSLETEIGLTEMSQFSQEETSQNATI